MNAGHTVTVTIDAFNQTIATEIAAFPQDDIFGQHIRQVIQLQDAEVRKALIKLGWTPPAQGRIQPTCRAGATPGCRCHGSGSGTLTTPASIKENSMAMLPPGEAALAGRIVNRTALFEEPTAESTYLLRFATLVKQAEDAGLIVTIERQPLKPLAMGNAQTVIDIRPARDSKAHRQAMWVAEAAGRVASLGTGPSIETGDA